ncbi:hypothetical protein PMI01_02220 [Caulobacter sp. AP07]|uniref:hypothetical protein n=1 Tax=Caulobacter sp. AP07 TaxID=1144304 RepID=UPI000272203A|nr:hypothetical protein [Caulobacter sp. AP07]EJL33257.1 hypothetical protein PMI01_02220 [Caulobacter sp. AP07]
MTTDAKKPIGRATAPDKVAGETVRPRAMSAASSAMLAAQRAVGEAISSQARDTQAAHRDAAQAVTAAVRAMAK